MCVTHSSRARARLEQVEVDLAELRAVDKRIVVGWLEESVLRRLVDAGRAAEQTSERGAAQLGELDRRERAHLVAVLKVEAIAGLEVVVLDAVDARERGPNVGAWEVALAKTAREKVHVLDNLVEATQLSERVWRNEQRQVLPGARLEVETVLEIVHVARNAVIATAPNVRGGQITARALLVRLVQVVAHVVHDPRVDVCRRTAEQTVDDGHEQAVVEQRRTHEPLAQTERWRLDVKVAVAHDARVQTERVLDLRVTKATRGSDVLVPRCWVGLWLVVSVLAAAGWQQLVVGAQNWTEHNGQVLAVRDHLILGNVDPTSLLEQRIIAPGWMAQLELLREEVVVAQHEQMQRGQGRMLVDARVARQITNASALALVLAGRNRKHDFALLVGAVLEQTAAEQTQLDRLLYGVTVHVRQVQKRRVLVCLLTWAKLAQRTHARSDKVQTRDVVALIELVAGRHVDWPTAAHVWLTTTIDEALVGGQRRVCDVVVDELTPLHLHQIVWAVDWHLVVHVRRHETRIWQRRARVIGHARRANTVRIIGLQQTNVAHIRLAPVWMVGVVAETVEGSVARVGAVALSR